MKLLNGDLRPGTVLEVLDNTGNIKASAPGLFSSEDLEYLPPIRPFGVGGSNNFSTPNVGDSIWVLSFTSNPEELFWFRRDDFSKNNSKFNHAATKNISGVSGTIQSQKNVEVLSSRRSGTGWATIYFSDGTGWIVQNVDSVIQLDQDGNVKLSNGQPHGTIEINDNGICLGTSGEAEHPCPHGDKVAELFDNIIGTLNKISEAAKQSPYTTAIADAIDGHVKNYIENSQYINSDIVTLD